MVSAAPKWELKHFLWSFPFVGKVPYKGYFKEADAQLEEKELKEKNLDTYLRGVSAFSTLGWFEDPLLSSMLAYKEHDLVATLIHETTHATLYIKNSADFNERLATFVGNKGAELFYLQQEGPQSATYQLMLKEQSDEKLFSSFITQELAQLEIWYKQNKKEDEPSRMQRISEIQQKFKTEILPQMKSTQYAKFGDIQLNNARLLIYKTYVQDLSTFEKLYEAVGANMPKFITACKKLEKHDNPEEGLKELLLSR